MLPVSITNSQVIGYYGWGIFATGKPSGHFMTQQDCSVCHDPSGWVPHIFMHTGLSYEPLDHRGNLACTRCHQSNSEVVNWPTPAYQPDCAGCHANDYRPGVDKHNGLSADRNCARCHEHSISASQW